MSILLIIINHSAMFFKTFFNIFDIQFINSGVKDLESIDTEKS